jgi:membrane fusion protein (multidrug efflux system)
MSTKNPGLRKRMIIMLIAVGIVLGLVAAFYVFKQIMTQKYVSALSSTPVTVSTMIAKNQEWNDYLKITGSTRAVRGVSVTSEVPGLIRDIYFKPGQNVTRGDILVQLNADDEIALLASLVALAELAEITYERDKAQFAADAISKETVDTDAANLKSAQAQVKQQEALIEKKTIRAPFNGKLGISQINPGQYINPGDPMVTLQALDPIYVDFYIPEQQFVNITTGMQINITSDAYKDKKFTGEITTINPLVDVSTRNIAIETTIPNPHGELLPGMFTRVEVVIGEPMQHITVPQAAISYNPYGNLVYLIEEQGKDEKGNPKLIAKQKFVTTGATRGDQIVILEGVKEGEQVITSGQLKLKNGSVVVINNSNPPSDNPHPSFVDQ